MESSSDDISKLTNITYVTGDILDSDADCLVNPVNTVGVMGKGLALKFKQAYPTMFDAYKKQCDARALNVGQLMFYRSDTKDKIICLFPTKQHWKNPSRVEYIELGLKSFVQYYKQWNIKKVAFPKIGCGLGGLNWELEVLPLITKYLSGLDVEVEIYI